MQIAQELGKIIDPRLITDSLIDRHAHAADAGFYFLLPKAIVFPETTDDIIALFRFCTEHTIPLTFRAAGTSLSGQSITDGILVDISRSFKKIQPLHDGKQVFVQPGAIGSHVNIALQKFGTKIGPDPASITAAMMGGILSNNSSGMCCGVVHNAYHALAAITIVLPNGRVFKTADSAAYQRFEQSEPTLCAGLLALQQRLLQQPQLVEKIRKKYRIKNTVGYSVHALLDYSHPLDMLSHLMIGAEGTLGFIADAVLNTIPDKPYKKTGLLFFDSPVSAANAIPSLQLTGAEALELMDRAALRSIEHLPDCPPEIAALPEQATAILCEFQSATKEALDQLFASALPVLENIPLLSTPEFTTDYSKQAKLWKLRKGLYPAVAAVRKKGTTALLEDVAVPIEHLGNAVTDLQDLFYRFGYHNAIIFGHAKEGNIHFLITQSVNDAPSIEIFDAFNQELAKIILQKYGGSMKAEHGTGRQIAPFVKEEWGEEIFQIMYELKELVDPHHILNPGVVINTDPQCHLLNLKTNPIVEEEVDRCVECGYCENRCPSRNFTLTPRQRIQVRRSLQRLQADKQTADYNELLDQYKYAGMDTCAVDGMCAVDCPVAINTGDLIKRLRSENHSALNNRISLWVARNFSWVAASVQIALRLGNLVNQLFGKTTLYRITQLVRKGWKGFPLYLHQLTTPVRIEPHQPADYQLVYFSTCITRMMGSDIEDPQDSVTVMKELCERANLPLFIPDKTGGTCCGQLFSSKGFYPAYQVTINKTIEDCWNWSKQGKLPIVLDVSSCTQSIRQCAPYLTDENRSRFEKLQFIDSVELVADWLLPRLPITQPKKQIALHPVCSLHKMGLTEKFRAVGNACAEVCVIPNQASCCGMAGDRGFYYPGLTEAATAAEIEALEGLEIDGCYSSGKTCEMALSEHAGKNYRSILYLLRDATAPINH